MEYIPNHGSKSAFDKRAENMPKVNVSSVLDIMLAEMNYHCKFAL